jgi:hypothetical protein
MYQAQKEQAYLHLSVAIDEALINARQMIATLIRHLCLGDPSVPQIRAWVAGGMHLHGARVSWT